MTSATAITVLLVLAFIAANLPWLSDRIFFIWTPKNGKPAWLRLAEWLLLYVLVGGIARGMEQKTLGQTHAQGWEFYAVTFCLFLVFALPGFIYRHDLRHLIDRARKRGGQS